MSQVQAEAQLLRLGRYALIDRLGIGGQGEVWRARDEMADVDVALKILAPPADRSAKAWNELEREYAVSSLLRHEGILRVLPPERIEGRVVLPMELASGGNLCGLRGMGYLQIVPVLLELAGALGYAHARGVVHRDLKPSNVLLDSAGRTKLADFGLAAVLPGSDADQDIARVSGGSPFTASPGQLRGEAPSPADDIYGLGALAYELLGGRPPHFPRFDADEIQRGPVPQLIAARPAPMQLIELVMRMLAKRVEERPSSMQEVAEELARSLNATLALDLAELADLAKDKMAASPPDTQKTPAPPDVSDTIHAVREPVWDVPSHQPGPLSQRARPDLRPERRTEVCEPPLSSEAVNPFADDVSSLRAMSLPEPEERIAWNDRSRTRPRRLRYVAFGLLCGAGGVAMALQGGTPLSPQALLRSLSTIVTQGRAGPSVATPHAIAKPATGPLTAANRRGIPASGSLVQQEVRVEKRLSALITRGVSTWDPSDFVAAKQQVIEATAAQETHDTSKARQHWHSAETLIARMSSRVPVALAAQPKAGRGTLTARRQHLAARASQSTVRLEGSGRQAADGERHVRSLNAALPLLREGRRAEQAGDDSRAAYDFEQAVAREPHYAPAWAALRRVRRNFRNIHYHRAVHAGLEALMSGRLYHAQADFMQALVFRPEGIEAAAELGKVNAALRKRATIAERVHLQRLGSD